MYFRLQTFDIWTQVQVTSPNLVGLVHESEVGNASSKLKLKFKIDGRIDAVTDTITS